MSKNKKPNKKIPLEPKDEKKHFARTRKRVRCDEEGQVNAGADAARAIQAEFNKLSAFKLVEVGTQATGKYVPDLIPTSPDLDFKVQLGDKTIAQLDTTGSNYTFGNSRIMPVRDYKGKKITAFAKKGLATYIIIWMKKEQGDLKDCCYWIKGEDVVKVPLELLITKEKAQYNYNTNKADWHKGLDGLVEELRRIAAA